MLIGTRVKELRKKKGLTQQDLGNLVNVTKVSISCYENGTRSPDLDTFVSLVDALDTTTDYLLGRDKLVVAEGNTSNKMYVQKEDIEIIKEINKNMSLSIFLRENPKRSVEYIVKKIK